MNCQFCGKEFSSKGNLSYHIKTAKYCIQQREIKEFVEEANDILPKENSGTKVKEILECNYCESKFLRKYNLDSHLSHCKIKKKVEKELEESKINENFQKEIEDIKNKYKEQIEFYEEIIENLKESHLQEINRINEYHNQILEGLKSHSQDFKRIVEIAVKKSDVQYIQNNDNRIDNSVKKVDNKYLNILVPFNLTREKVKEVIDSKFTEEVFYHGIAGLANLVFKELFRTGEGKYIVHCTDLSRKVFLFIDESGTPIKDYRAQRILELVGPPIVERNQEIIEEILRKYAIYKKNKQPDEETGIYYDENRVNFSNEIYQNNNKIMSEPNDFVSSLSVHCANIPLRS